MLKRLSALCAVAALCALLVPVGARATPATEAFIQQNFDKGYLILNNISLSEAQRRKQFRDLLLDLAASRRIALFTLGPYAAGAAPGDTEAFVQAFTNYSVAVYEKGLNRYEGQALKVTGSSDPATDDSVVRAELVSPNRSNGQSIKVAFRVRRDESGAPTVTDIQIEGVSLAITERDDFTGYLQQHKGSVPELSKRLNAMSDEVTRKTATLPGPRVL
jgi:phospholipid transport system substrate-binding protein